jgi:hypothetical protein
MLLDVLDEHAVKKTVEIYTHNGTLDLKVGHSTPWGAVQIIQPLGDGTWFVGTLWTPGKKRSSKKSARLMDLIWKGNCERLFVAPLVPHSLSTDAKRALAKAFTDEFGFRKIPGLETGLPVVLSGDDWPASIPLPQYALFYQPPERTPHWRDPNGWANLGRRQMLERQHRSNGTPDVGATA